MHRRRLLHSSFTVTVLYDYPSGLDCLKRDLQIAGEMEYNSAKKKIQGPAQPSLMSVLILELSGLGGHSHLT